MAETDADAAVFDLFAEPVLILFAPQEGVPLPVVGYANAAATALLRLAPGASMAAASSLFHDRNAYEAWLRAALCREVHDATASLRITDPPSPFRIRGRPRADSGQYLTILTPLASPTHVDAAALLAMTGGHLLQLTSDGTVIGESGSVPGALDADVIAQDQERWQGWIDRTLALRVTSTFETIIAVGGTPVAHAVTMMPVSQGAVVARVLPLSALPPVVAAATAVEGASTRDERWLNGIVDHIGDGIVVFAIDGTVDWLNRSAEDIFDVGRETAVGQPIGELIVPVDEEGDVLAILLDRRRSRVGVEEMLARRRSGPLIPVELTVTAIENGEPARFILIVRDITLRKETEETIRNLAYQDVLTGLPNRLLFHDRLSQGIERARRTRQRLAVMLVDLDRFKLVNDSLGLGMGDRLLRGVARRLVETLRRSDTVARLGGDEFLVLAVGTETADSAARVAEKLLEALAQPIRVNGHELAVAASVGIAMFPDDGGDADSLLKNADTALSRAKEQGRSHYEFYTTDMNAKAFERLMLENQLRHALTQGELTLHYQPQVDLATGAITAFEALVRWQHAELGMVSPAQFIPIAEDTGLIVAIGAWVLRTACAQMRLWHEQGHPHLRIAVNISARQFQRRELATDVARILAETGLAAGSLELELTESTIMRDVTEANGRLLELTALGLRLSVDDFGTGYSSLAYLTRLPIHALKIDRSFIRDITADPNNAAVAQAVVALAATLSLDVVAEGVETAEQLALLRRYECQAMQGFLFSRPLPPDEATALLTSGARLAD